MKLKRESYNLKLIAKLIVLDWKLMHKEPYLITGQTICEKQLLDATRFIGTNSIVLKLTIPTNMLKNNQYVFLF